LKHLCKAADAIGGFARLTYQCCAFACRAAQCALEKIQTISKLNLPIFSMLYPQIAPRSALPRNASRKVEGPNNLAPGKNFAERLNVISAAKFEWNADRRRSVASADR
jgi:hypothetical protein